MDQSPRYYRGKDVQATIKPFTSTETSEVVADELCQRLRLQNTVETPSQEFRIALLVACLQSMQLQDNSTIVASPVLLLDEWLDKETSTVIQAVQDGIKSLIELGACICIVTHYPERFKPVKRLLLRSGKLVNITKKN
jgi:ABC-type siderophore export system fused ATPase/permease subunit